MPPAQVPAVDPKAEFSALLEAVRVGVLITMNERGPFGSHVPFVLMDDWSRVIIHVSKLSQHTKNLERDGRISLFIAEPDEAGKNPLSLKRANLQGNARALDRESPDYAATQEKYQARFPQSALMFGFGDFQLWELQMHTAHLVAGFGRAFLAAASQPDVWAHQGK